jgi:hypothetical protein
LERLHPASGVERFPSGGREVLGVASRILRVKARVPTLVVGAGPRSRGAVGGLWRGRSPGEHRPPARLAGVERTDSQGEQGFEAGEAIGFGTVPSLEVAGTRDPGASPEKGCRKPLGSGRRRLRALARGPSGAKPRGTRLGPAVNDCKGAGGLERGTRSLGGEGSEGRRSGMAAARNKAVEPGLAQTAERLRKPESGFGAVETGRFSVGLAQGCR